MTETIVLCGIIVFLIGFIVFKELMHLKEKDILLDKIMSRNFVEYTNAKIAETYAKKESKEKAPAQQIF